jgi:hypothetical protein
VADLSDDRRDALHAFMQQAGCADERAAGALLTGWVVVQAWVDPSGERWLTRAHAAELPTWGAVGLHHEALYGDWDDPE